MNIGFQKVLTTRDASPFRACFIQTGHGTLTFLYNWEKTMRSYTDMCLDGPVDHEGAWEIIKFEEPCIISSVKIIRQTGWDGKRFGDIRAVEFRNVPSEEDLRKTGTMENSLKWKGAGYNYDYTVDPLSKHVFIEYLVQFNKDIINQMQAYLGSNYPKQISDVSEAPVVTVK